MDRNNLANTAPLRGQNRGLLTGWMLARATLFWATALKLGSIRPTSLDRSDGRSAVDGMIAGMGSSPIRVVLKERLSLRRLTVPISGLSGHNWPK